MDFKEGVNIRVIYKGVGERPNRVEIPNSLTALQACVGGAAQIFSITCDVAIVSTEFPQDKCLPYNCSFLGRDWCGPLLIVGFDGFEFCSLSENAMETFENAMNEKVKAHDVP